MEERRYTTEKNDLMRIDKFLSEKLPDLSRSYLQKLIKEKDVTCKWATGKSKL